MAGIGFVNYILWKLYGARGVELAAFLAGLVNSTVAVRELCSHASGAGVSLIRTAYRGVLLATAAMLLRNAILLGILAPPALICAAVPLLLMLLACISSVFLNSGSAHGSDSGAPTMQIASPFSLAAALKFGLLFLALDVAGTLAQRSLGPIGFYAVSFVGGLVSSASSVASAGVLAAHGHITPQAAGHGAILATLSSVFINWPLAMRVGKQRQLTKSLAQALGAVIAIGIVGMIVRVSPPDAHLRFQPGQRLRVRSDSPDRHGKRVGSAARISMIY